MDDFVNYYVDSCRQNRTRGVLMDLNAHGYDCDLHGFFSKADKLCA